MLDWDAPQRLAHHDASDVVDPEPYVNPGLPGLLAASEKLLAINRGLVEPDERDSFLYKRVYHPVRRFREGIRLDSGKLRLKMLRYAAKSRRLDHMHAGQFDGYVKSQILGNPLSMPLEEINPLHLEEQSRRITQMGPGGIGSDDAVTPAMQNLHASTFGFLSILEGPESSRAGVDTRAAYGTKLGSDGKVYQKFFDRRTGEHHYYSPEDIDGLAVKIPD